MVCHVNSSEYNRHLKKAGGYNVWNVVTIAKTKDGSSNKFVDTKEFLIKKFAVNIYERVLSILVTDVLLWLEYIN